MPCIWWGRFPKKKEQDHWQGRSCTEQQSALSSRARYEEGAQMAGSDCRLVFFFFFVPFHCSPTKVQSSTTIKLVEAEKHCTGVRKQSGSLSNSRYVLMTETCILRTRNTPKTSIRAQGPLFSVLLSRYDHGCRSHDCVQQSKVSLRALDIENAHEQP